MQDKGSTPIELLPHLLALIEQYHTLKTEEADFKLFKKAAQNLFKFLYQNRLEDINYFYGIEIQHKGKKYYLLDLLIIINKAESYVLDEHLDALATWLYNYNPALQSTSPELESVYAKLKRRNSHRCTDMLSLDDQRELLLSQSLSLVLSLFTVEFDYLPLTGSTIKFWDMTNKVFSEAVGIFSLFEPLLINNRVDELFPLYQKVISECITPERSDASVYTWITRYQCVSDWYEHAENNTLSKINVEWFQPEMLIHTLLRFSTDDGRVMSQIDRFLDELIHTYTQNKPELFKKFRVNILFSDCTRNLIMSG